MGQVFYGSDQSDPHDPFTLILLTNWPSLLHMHSVWLTGSPPKSIGPQLPSLTASSESLRPTEAIGYVITLQHYSVISKQEAKLSLG